MKKVLNKSILFIASMTLLLGCAKTQDDKSESTSSTFTTSYVNPDGPFTDYPYYLFVRGSKLLEEEDKETGICFHSYEELVNYSTDFEFTQTGEGVDYEFRGTILEAMEHEDFTNRKLILAPEVMLPNGGIILSFNEMYFKDDILTVSINRVSRGGGSASISYGTYAFFVSKNLYYEKIVTTIVNDYR